MCVCVFVGAVTAAGGRPGVRRTDSSAVTMRHWTRRHSMRAVTRGSWLMSPPSGPPGASSTRRPRDTVPFICVASCRVARRSRRTVWLARGPRGTLGTSPHPFNKTGRSAAAADGRRGAVGSGQRRPSPNCGERSQGTSAFLRWPSQPSVTTSRVGDDEATGSGGGGGGAPPEFVPRDRRCCGSRSVGQVRSAALA